MNTDLRDEEEKIISTALEVEPATVTDVVAARDWVQRAMFLIDEQTNAIKSQIDEAKGNAVGGQYADPDWWRRVNSALRHKGRQRQELQVKLGELNRLVRQQHASHTGNLFIDVAREMLPPETFAMLIAETRARKMRP